MTSCCKSLPEKKLSERWPCELRDWQGGSINSDGQLDANRRAVELAVPFESVRHVEYEGFYYSGDGRITMHAAGVTAEFGGYGGRHLIFQGDWRNLLAHVSGGVSPGCTYLATLDLSRVTVHAPPRDCCSGRERLPLSHVLLRFAGSGQAFRSGRRRVCRECSQVP